LPLIAFCERAAGSSPDRAGRGNPAHLIALAGLRAERESLQKTVRAYEQGRFMRFMRWLKGG
jgi:hypothetical protein